MSRIHFLFSITFVAAVGSALVIACKEQSAEPSPSADASIAISDAGPADGDLDATIPEDTCVRGGPCTPIPGERSSVGCHTRTPSDELYCSKAGTWELDCSHYGCQGYGISCRDAAPTPADQCPPRWESVIACSYAGEHDGDACNATYTCQYTGTFFEWVSDAGCL